MYFDKKPNKFFYFILTKILGAEIIEEEMKKGEEKFLDEETEDLKDIKIDKNNKKKEAKEDDNSS